MLGSLTFHRCSNQKPLHFNQYFPRKLLVTFRRWESNKTMHISYVVNLPHKNSICVIRYGQSLIDVLLVSKEQNFVLFPSTQPINVSSSNEAENQTTAMTCGLWLSTGFDHDTI